MQHDPKRWVWTDKGAEQMNERPGTYVWDNYQASIPTSWITDGLVREATTEDGEPGQVDLFDVIKKG